jgi:hypothetical protein
VQQEASEVRGGGEAQSEGHPEKSSLTDVPHVGGKRRGLPNGQLGLPKAASPECLLGVGKRPSADPPNSSGLPRANRAKVGSLIGQQSISR